MLHRGTKFFILGALIYLHNKSLICVSLLGSNFDKNKL